MSPHLRDGAAAGCDGAGCVRVRSRTRGTRSGSTWEPRRHRRPGGRRPAVPPGGKWVRGRWASACAHEATVCRPGWTWDAGRKQRGQWEERAGMSCLLSGGAELLTRVLARRTGGGPDAHTAGRTGVPSARGPGRHHFTPALPRDTSGRGVLPRGAGTASATSRPQPAAGRGLHLPGRPAGSREPQRPHPGGPGPTLPPPSLPRGAPRPSGWGPPACLFLRTEQQQPRLEVFVEGPRPPCPPDAPSPKTLCAHVSMPVSGGGGGQ